MVGGAFFLTAYWVHRNNPSTDNSDLATLLMAILVGSCIGFLPHNWFPAKIFMGDSGAMLIGLLMASAGVVATGADRLRSLRPRQRYPPPSFPSCCPSRCCPFPLLDLGGWPLSAGQPGANRRGRLTAGTSTTSWWTLDTRTAAPSSCSMCGRAFLPSVASPLPCSPPGKSCSSSSLWQRSSWPL